MKKKLAFILALAFCAAMLCTGALADGERVLVGGVWLDADAPYAKADETGQVTLSDETDYNIYWDAAANTLELNGATIRSVPGTYPHAIFTLSKNGLNIVLNGSNSAICEGGNRPMGVYAMDGRVSISGTGSLTVKSVGTCIRSGDGDLEISGNVTIEAVSSEDCGMVSSGAVTISGGADVRMVSNADISGTAVQSAGDMAITDSSLYAENKSSNVYSISVVQDLRIVNSQVEAISEQERGINAGGSLEISGSSVNAWGGSTAIVAYTGLSITGGEVTAFSETDHGIYSFSTMSISGGAVVDAGSSAGAYVGLMAHGDMTIDSSTVRSSGGPGSPGIYSLSGAIIVSGMSDVTIKSDTRALISALKLCPAEGVRFTVLGGTDEGSAAELDISPVTEETQFPAGEIVTRYLRIYVPVATPVLTGSGSFYGSMTVEISCETEGAVIYYTTDGSEPTESSTRYTGPFEIYETATVKAIAVKDGMAASQVAAATYKRVAENIPDIHYIAVQDSAGGSVEAHPGNVSANAVVTLTVTPDEGNALVALSVTDAWGREVELTKAGENKYTFVMPDSAVTVKALFAPALPFADVAADAWYCDAVAYVYANGLMEGVSETLFAPNANMSRAMVWAILARIDGEEITGADWVADAREWAMANGVSDGTDANGFVTREQFVTMLYRYAGEPATAANLDGYTDGAGVSAWAVDAMAWAVEKGIITGVTDTTLAPRGTATRAQCAAMLMRFDTM